MVARSLQSQRAFQATLGKRAQRWPERDEEPDLGCAIASPESVTQRDRGVVEE